MSLRFARGVSELSLILLVFLSFLVAFLTFSDSIFVCENYTLHNALEFSYIALQIFDC
jgi:EamA domain-containing membrane protein RarD